MFKLKMLLVNFFYYLLESVNKIDGTSRYYLLESIDKIDGTSKRGYIHKSVEVKSKEDLI